MSYFRFCVISILCLNVAFHFDGVVVAQDTAIASSPPDGAAWTRANFWSVIDQKRPVDSWEFTEGEIRLVKPRGGKGSLISPPLPSNFDLSFQWKIDARTNTGLKYRVRKYGSKYYGLEYQILDDKPSDTHKGSTAAIYDLVGASSQKKLNPPGQWNSARIVADGVSLRHYLNGVLVSSAETVGPGWDFTFALNKFWGFRGFAQPGDQSRIMLTDHGGKAAYRNFQFTALESPELPVQAPSSGPFLANGMRNSWADQTSIVLWTRTTRHPEMNLAGQKFPSAISCRRQETFQGQ